MPDGTPPPAHGEGLHTGAEVGRERQNLAAEGRLGFLDVFDPRDPSLTPGYTTD